MVSVDIFPKRFHTGDRVTLTSEAQIGSRYGIAMDGFVPVHDEAVRLAQAYRIDAIQREPLEQHLLRVLDTARPFIRVHFYTSQHYFATAKLDFDKDASGVYVPSRP